MELRTYLVAILFLGSTLAGPISWDDSKCARECSESKNKFQYEQDKTYNYQYASKSDVKLTDNTGHEVAVEMTARVEIGVVSPCEMVLQLRDVSLSNSEESSFVVFKSALEARPLAFSFDDGVIRDLCPHPDDEDDEYVINIKRAILSALQNSADTLDSKATVAETDISGVCQTSYEKTNTGWNSVTILKSKDLKSCSKRHNTPISTYATTYLSEDSPIQNLPLLDGELRCEQVMGQGIIQNVRCNEKNLFTPLSREGKGVQVESQISLIYKSVQDGVHIQTERPSRHSNLLFATNPVVSAESSERDARNVVTEMCQLTRDGVQPRIPFLIGQLIAAVRPLPVEKIESIYASLENNQLCPSQIVEDLFIDALAIAGTKGPIKLLAKLVLQEKVSKIRAQAWFTMLAFNQHADEEAIRALIPILKNSEIGGRQATFGISALIHNFCEDDSQHHSKDCREIPVVKEALEALRSQLKCKTHDEEEEDVVVEALMGIENIGRVGPAKDAVIECFSQHENSNVIRHAALRAFRQVPCEKNVVRKMLDIFKDQSEDAEIRIYSYLAAMRCADHEVVREVKDVLDKEVVNQVGAFVWSHLKNLQETSSPMKQEIRSIVLELNLVKKFSTDLRKFSQYIEWSAFSDRMNVGSDIEMSIVRSPKSFIPRSAFMNVSTHIFGDSVSLIEVGGHMEGLEHWVESYFGDNGFLKGMKIEDLFEMFGIAKKDVEEEDNSVEESTKSRSARSTNYNRLNLLQERMHIETPNKPKGSVYLSLLGRKIARVSSHDMKELVSLNEAFSLMEILTALAKNQKVERSLSVQFLDVEMTLPTISGMKMSLALNGTATVAAKIDGKFDIRKLLTNDRSADINGMFSPSAAVEIVALISVDSGVHKPGLKTVFNAHTSQHIEGKLEIKNGRIMNLKFNMPKDKIEIITVKSDMYTVEKNGEEKAIRPDKYYNAEGCTKSLNKPLGIELCGKWRAPKPLFSENTPFAMVAANGVFQISIQKTDRSMTGYELNVVLPSEHDETKLYKVEFDTPSSNVDRHFALEATTKCGAREHLLNLKMRSPYKKADISASVVNEPSSKHARLAMTVDDNQHYSVESVIKIKEQGNVVEYHPSITIEIPREEPIILQGTVSYNKGRKQQMTIDLKANRPSNKPSFIKGTIMREGDFSLQKLRGILKLSTDLTMKCPFLEARLHGTINKDATLYSKDVSFDYKLPGRNQHTVKFVSKIQDLGNKHLTEIKTYHQITFTQIPEYNAKLLWDIQNKALEHIENEITYVYGEDFPEENKFHLLQVSKLEGVDSKGRRGKSENKIIVEAPFLDEKAEMHLITDWNVVEKPHFDAVANVKYGQEKLVDLSVDYTLKSNEPIEMQVVAKLNTKDREMMYQDTLRERSPNEFEGKTTIQWQRGQKATIDYLYRVKSDTSKVHHEVELKLSSPTMKIPIHQKGLLRFTTQAVDVRSTTHYEGKPLYSLEATLSREGESKLEVKVPEWEGEVEVHNDEDRKTFKVELESEKNKVHWLASARYASDSRNVKSSLEIEASVNPESDPSNKYIWSTELTRTEEHPVPKYNLESTVKMGKSFSVKLSGDLSSDISVGPHDLTLEIKPKTQKPFSVNLQHEIDNGVMKCGLSYSLNNEEKLSAEAIGKYHSTSKTLDVSWGVILRSQYKNLDGKEIYLGYKSDESSAPKYNAKLRFQESADKPYNLDVEYLQESARSGKGKLHTILTTPIAAYRSQEATFSGEVNKNLVRFDYEVASAKGKKYQGSYKGQKNGLKIFSLLEIETPFKALETLKVQSEVDYSHVYTTSTTVEVNGEKKAEWNVKLATTRDSIDGSVDIYTEMQVKYDINLKVMADKKKKNLEFSVKRENSELIASELLWQKQGKNYNGRINLKGGDKNWLAELKSEDQVYTITSRGVGTPVTVTFKCETEDNSYAPELIICAKEISPDCFEVKGEYKNLDHSRGSLHRELQVKISQEPHLDFSLEYLLKSSDNSFVNKMEIEAFKKEVGWEIQLESADKSTALIRVKLPSRQMLAKAEYEEEKDTASLKIELLPDAVRQPSRKLSIEVDHTVSHHGGVDLLHNNIVISHPVLQRPIKVDIELKSRSGEVPRPLEAKMEIEYTSDPQKKILATAYLEKPHKDDSNITTYFNIYQVDRKDLDFMIKGHVASREDRLTVGKEWHWTSQGKKHQGSYFLEVDNREDEIHYFYRSPNNNFEAHGSWKYESGKVLDFDLTTEYNQDKNALKLVVDIPKPCVELTFFEEPETPSSRYHMCINSEGKSLLTITAESYVSEEKLTDATIAFDRRGDRTFSMHLHWRPEKLGEIMAHMMDLSEKFSVDIGAEEFVEKVMDKLELFYTDFSKIVAKPVIEFITREITQIWKEISIELRKISKTWKRITERIPDLGDVFEPIYNAVGKMVKDLVLIADDFTPRIIKKWVKEYMNYVGGVLESACSYGTVCYKMKYAYNRHGLEGVAEYVYSVLENMPAGYYKIAVTMKDFIEENMELPSMNMEPIGRIISNWAERLEEIWEPFMELEWVNSLSKFAEKMNMWFENWYTDIIDNIKERVEVVIEKLEKSPEFRAAFKIIRDIYNDITKEMKKVNLEKTLVKIVDYTREMISAENLKNSIHIASLDPEAGTFDLEIRLPTDINTIRHNLQSVNPFSAVRDEDQDDYDSGVIGTHVQKVKAAVSNIHTAVKQGILPPFAAHGQMIAGMHYKTFDNSFYDFAAGDCSYLLARDFVDGNFSVIVKYEGEDDSGNIDKSLLVIMDDQVIEIDPDDETVTVNGQETELPIVFKYVTVTRRGNNIVVDTRRGLSVTCNLVHDFCTTAISGWYHGKTAGLFGTFDNEASNDYMRPKGQISRNQAEFAQSWAVANNCKYRNLVKDVDIEVRDPKYDICRKYFKSQSSPMSDCFGEVDEKEYLRMCIRQVAIQRNPENALCSIAAAYNEICDRRRINIIMPSVCMKCEQMQGSHIAFGDRKTYQGSQPQSADIVFVIEERECNRPLLKDIASLTKTIDRELDRNGLKNNRFGVVAFGGRSEEEEAHSHTARGKLFFDAKDVVLATEKIHLKQSRDKPDTFGAVKFAVRYPFRAGVSKTLILMTCSQCDEQSMTVDYSDIQNTLLDHGIILHMLSNRNLVIKGSPSKNRGTVFGLDANTVYRARDVSQPELEGTPDLRSKISVPKDICVALAQEVHGSFFTTKYLVQGSTTESKNLKSLLARRVSESAEPHECQKCDCDAADDNTPQTICRPCKALSPRVPVSSYIEDEY